LADAVESLDATRRLFRKSRVDSIDVMTGESFVEPLTRFFRARSARL
jgi:hypothetical protein